MGRLKISLITVTFNTACTIESCITSVIGQCYPNLEFIIIDGGSTDDTLTIIDKYKAHIHQIVSEPDNGMYDAMNKGIKLATGDVVGMLNADDFFADSDVLNYIAQSFELSVADIIYGDINYINKKGKIIRKWHSGTYRHGDFNWGWMPPHPSFYAKKHLFKQWGPYRPEYGSATDYELMLRFIHTHKAKVFYVDKILVNMLVGGISNKNISNRIKAWRNDYKAMGNNGLLFPYFSIVWKPFRKIIQYIR